MPKKPQPPVRSSNVHIPRRHTFLAAMMIVVVLAAISVVGYKIHHTQAVHADKARFARAEQDVDELSRQIIAATGPPLKINHDKFCSRPNMEIVKGPLSCNIDVDFEYNAMSPDEANVLHSSVNNLLKSHPGYAALSFMSAGTTPIKTFSVTGNNINNEQKIIENYTDSRLRVRYDVAYILNSQASQNTTSTYSFQISISCSDRALAEYYPLNH